MKKQSSPNIFFLLPFFVLFFVSCSNDDGADIPTATENIVQLAVANANLSTLVTALQRADLVSTLEGNGPFTVLAPTNAAFSTFFIANGFSGVDQVPVELLKQILLNHVLGATIRSSDFAGFQSGYAKTLANGLSTGTKISLYFDANQGIIFNGVSEVISGGANLMASNGVIHIVDAVVKLPTVADFVLLDENFASLEAALKIQGQPDFISILGTSNGTDPAPFTLFAPINQAFSNIPATIPVDELTNILEHHIIPGNNIPSSGITNGLVSPPTLEGDVITFFISGTLISATDGAGNGDKNIIAADLQAANGVVHVIDKVLIPDTSN